MLDKDFLLGMAVSRKRTSSLRSDIDIIAAALHLLERFCRSKTLGDLATIGRQAAVVKLGRLELTGFQGSIRARAYGTSKCGAGRTEKRGHRRREPLRRWRSLSLRANHFALEIRVGVNDVPTFCHGLEPACVKHSLGCLKRRRP
jgi:hypothetical protein